MQKVTVVPDLSFGNLSVNNSKHTCNLSCSCNWDSNTVFEFYVISEIWGRDTAQESGLSCGKETQNFGPQKLSIYFSKVLHDFCFRTGVSLGGSWSEVFLSHMIPWHLMVCCYSHRPWKRTSLAPEPPVFLFLQICHFHGISAPAPALAGGAFVRPPGGQIGVHHFLSLVNNPTDYGISSGKK